MQRYMAISEARQQFSKLLDETLKGNEIIITKHGKPVVALIDLEQCALMPRPRYRAPALTSGQPGPKPLVEEGPYDHGTLGSASLSGIAGRFWPRPCRWLFSQPSFCLAMFTTRPMACSNELKFGKPLAS